jgi:O-antigen/teichoic acid export membrane protein
MMGLRQGSSRIGMLSKDGSLWYRFRRNLSINLLSSGLYLSIKFGQTALLINYLSIDDYGRVLIILNLIVFLNSFIGLRVSDLIFRFFQQLIEEEDVRALQGLLLLCLGISLLTGLLISGGLFILSPWLAGSLYKIPEIAPLLYIFGGTVLLLSLSEVYEPILRIYDRFSAIAVPQVLGNLATMLMLIIYFTTTDVYNLKIIVAAFAIGVLIQTVPPLVQALRLVMPTLSDVKVRLAAQALARYRPELLRCLFNSNLSGYLKFAISPGDVFLLGIFSSPSQVALYGLARQFTAPLAIFQTNIQTAITPEITSLIAKRKYDKLKRFLGRCLGSALILGGLLTACAFLLGRFLILAHSKPEYVFGLPVFYFLLLASWVLLIFAVFRPLALSLDLLNWHNLAQLTSALMLFFFIVTHNLNAMTLAYVQLAAALVIRPLFNIPVWRRLRALIVNSSPESAHKL